MKLAWSFLLLILFNEGDLDLLIGKWRFCAIGSEPGTDEKKERERKDFYKEKFSGTYFYFDGQYHGKVSNSDTLFNVPYHVDKQKLIINNNGTNVFSFKTKDTLILFDVNTEEELKLVRESE